MAIAIVVYERIERLGKYMERQPETILEYLIMSKTKPLLLAVLILLIAPFISSSPSVNGQNKEERIRIDTNLVLLNVLVRDKNGQFVTGLRSDQFELLVDDRKRPIEGFSAGEAAVSFGIIFDMHPTTGEHTGSVIESLRQFRTELGPSDDIFLIAFNMLGEQTFDFIPTVEQLERHMADPGRREPYSLYDAVYFASDRIQSSRNQKRVLLIISDSADHRSRRSISQVREKVNEIKAEVYAGIFDEGKGYGYSDITHPGREIYPFSRDATLLDRKALLDLTLNSGGAPILASHRTLSDSAQYINRLPQR